MLVSTLYEIISWFGRGIQRRLPPDLKVPDVDTVQGIIEHGIKTVLKLPKGKELSLILSSRTDAGVHALLNTCHLNLEEIPTYNCPVILCQSLNLFLEKNETEIRVKRIVEVPQSFHCRYDASSRTYRYRVALLKHNDLKTTVALKRLSSALTVTELNRCHIVRQPFDRDIVFEACNLFLGTWNFKSFCGHITKDERDNKPEEYFVKTIERFSFSLMNTVNSVDSYNWEPASNEYDLYEFNIEGSGFVRRQVRRMVGAILNVGSGVNTMNDLLFLLKNPSEKNWKGDIESASAGGLYLKSVNYKNVPVLRGFLS